MTCCSSTAPRSSARSRETVKRGGASSLSDALANAADYGYCASHSRYFYGFRLHTLFAIDGTPRAMALLPKIDEKQVCLQMVARCKRQPGQFLTLIGDKNFRGRHFEAALAAPRRRESIARAAKTSPARDHTSRRSARASSRSTGPPRTS